jgi:hypothetical protein
MKRRKGNGGNGKCRKLKTDRRDVNVGVMRDCLSTDTNG